MDSYARASSAFGKAYRNQLEAADRQRAESTGQEAQFGEDVRQSAEYEAGAPMPPDAVREMSSESGFDQPMDDRVESMKNGLLKEARSRMQSVAPTDY